MHRVYGETIDLRIDFREQRSGIVEELERLDTEYTFQIEQLPTGDYWIGDRIIIERKTLFDFMVSIKTGRVFQQGYSMAQSGKNGLIILEGDKSDISKGEMSRQAVQGAMVHLSLFLGIPIIRSINIVETASLLAYICSQSKRQELPRPKSIIRGIPGMRITKKQRQKLFLIQNLQGIGTKKGLALLRSLGTIENILNTSTDDLLKVKGIGRRLAERIFTVFHEPF
jgi:DNA excision repair protein ERCC-4